MKKIVIFGASGGTGKQVVAMALQQGFEVTTIIRNPDAFYIQHPNLKIAKGDILAPSTFKNKLQGQDAVISCLGVPKIQETTLYSAGIRNIVQSMQEVGLDRILCISSGALDIPPGSSFIMRFLLKNVLQRIYKPIYTDMRLMEDTLKASGLNWTIVRAPKLTDGKNKGRNRNITGQPLKGIPQISRADLAGYLLEHLDDLSVFKQTVDVAY
nr:SDR family oxidoreductase [uncultured Mucilaginibacter sp.]